MRRNLARRIYGAIIIRNADILLTNARERKQKYDKDEEINIVENDVFDFD